MKNNEGYLKNNIIAYIGNKRNLLSLIEKAVKSVKLKRSNQGYTFLDLFAGSGSVSRLAKSLGFKVITNDWEYYSYIINKAFIELDNSFLKKSFKKLGGLSKVLSILNNLNSPEKKDKYISKYYCPEDDDNPDLLNERLFYTNYNGKRIDVIRAKIESWSRNKKINKNEEYLLLALLLYEASTRSNTSGVFKGFHKGFGGTNGDALSRILKPIELREPELINGKKSIVVKEDAVKLSEKLKNQKIDILYLDPPYNQHQYGSNYHLLNTIALNDKPVVNKNIYINGKKTNKSAIRKDWIETKSTFCNKKTAIEDFKKIVNNINAHYIFVSYSTDGIISFDDMLRILSDKGKLTICLSEYVKYRGGKQSINTQVRNIEFVLIVDSTKKGSINDIKKIKKILYVNKINIFMKKTINPIRAESIGFYHVNNNNIIFTEDHFLQKFYDDYNIILKLNNNRILNIDKLRKEFAKLNLRQLKMIYRDLEYITNLTKEDEIYLSIDEIFKFYKLNMNKKCFEVFKEIPYYLSKFNNKKNYISSLKSIIAVLNMLIQTIDIWQKTKIVNYTFFNKFERIILFKLNHDFQGNYSKEYITGKYNDEMIKINEYKRKISSLYEYLINSLEVDTNAFIKKSNDMFNPKSIDELNYMIRNKNQKIKSSFFN
jgi:adenine-specific DNA-methyltransferase